MIYNTNMLISEEAIFSKDKKNPVYIVLSSGSSLFANAIKKVTKNEFSHAMISFNSKLNPLYSFGTRPDGKLGFVINSPKDRVWDIDTYKYSVYVMYVTNKAKKSMENRLKYFVDNEKDLRYDFKGILDIWRGKESESHEKWFCSRFVMELISKSQSLSKVPSLWRPGDITELDNISLVNRGFNFYNYDYKVTDKHCSDIKKGVYDPGDVIYEGSSTNKQDNYAVTGSSVYLEEIYNDIYSSYDYKIPVVRFPGDNESYEDLKKAAIKAAEDYYTFKSSDINKDYPFKFYNILNISKDYYMKLINGATPFRKRDDSNIYHCNINNGDKRISVIIIADSNTIYAMYLLLQNNVLYRFNYEGMLFQESVIEELSSSIEKDFVSKKDMSLSQFTKMNLTDAIIQVYKQNYPSLTHIRINKNTRGCIWLDGKSIVGYINVEEKEDDTKWIQAFEIYNPYKGHGLSKQMLDMAIKEFNATNLSVNKDNEVAIKIYKSCGFKIYKSTDSMYFMSKYGSMDESYFVYDPVSGKDIKTAYTDNDYKITAQLAQDKLRELKNQGKYSFINITDVRKTDDNCLIYAEYCIKKDIDEVYLDKFVKMMNMIVKTSTYCGEFIMPEDLSTNLVGVLKLKIDIKWVSESDKTVSEKGIKSYVNPARQLKVKNTKKRNDQISKGNYSDITLTSPPSTPPTKKDDNPEG